MAEALDKLDLDAISGDVSEEFTSLYSFLMGKVGPSLAANYYSTGYDAYKAEDYETAIANLAKAYQYDNTNVNTLYYLGNAYYSSGNTDKAQEIFDEVVTQFPDTKSTQGAQTQLAEINNSGN